MKPWALFDINKSIENLEVYFHSPFLYARGCCQSEVENAFSSTYDIARLGVAEIQTQPSMSDLLIVSGWVSADHGAELQKIYDAMKGRRSVIAFGACAVSASPFLVPGERALPLSHYLPVDVYVPGCPPRPEALVEAIRLLKEKLKPGPDQRTVLLGALKEVSR